MPIIATTTIIGDTSMRDSSSIVWIEASEDYRVDTGRRSSGPIAEISIVLTDQSFEEITALTLLVNPALSPKWQNWKPSANLSARVSREAVYGVSAKAADQALCETLTRVGGTFIRADPNPANGYALSLAFPHFSKILNDSPLFDIYSVVKVFEFAEVDEILPIFDEDPSDDGLAAIYQRIATAEVALGALRTLDSDETI